MANATMNTNTRTRKPTRPTQGTCRLSLTINGVAYAVRPVPCDPTAAQRCWSLRKSDGTIYHASLQSWGAECDCPDFVFRRDGLDPAGCKHLKALRALGIVD